MKTILRRKDNSSIFCPSIQNKASNHKYQSFSIKTKVIEFCLASILIATGLFLLINSL